VAALVHTVGCTLCSEKRDHVFKLNYNCWLQRFLAHLLQGL